MGSSTASLFATTDLQVFAYRLMQDGRLFEAAETYDTVAEQFAARGNRSYEVRCAQFMARRCREKLAAQLDRAS